MIETVLDANDNDKFLNRTYRVINPSAILDAPFSAYRNEAKKIISAYAAEAAIIIPEADTVFSINKLALALFVESCKVKNNLEFAVFKVKNLPKKTESYKPYVALTVAVKYVMRLINESPQNAFRDIANLSYLGLDIKHDYAHDKLFMSLQRKDPIKKIKSSNFSETLTLVGILKALSLTHTDTSIQAEIDCLNYDTPIDLDEIIDRVIGEVMPLIDCH